MLKGNLLHDLPSDTGEEQVEALIDRPGMRIERIVSRGQASPPGFWYDQDEHEWVSLLQGAAVIVFADGREVRLEAGDHVDIPAHVRHRVAWTHPDVATIWLAVFHT